MIPNLEINGILFERVKNLNLFTLVLNENMPWKSHIDLLANRLAKCAGVLNKLKSFNPLIEAEGRIYASVNWPSSVQTMACRLDGARPLSEPMMEYC